MCIWWGFAGFMIGGTVGIIAMALVNIGRGERIDVRAFDPDGVGPLERVTQ